MVKYPTSMGFPLVCFLYALCARKRERSTRKLWRSYGKIAGVSFARLTSLLPLWEKVAPHAVRRPMRGLYPPMETPHPARLRRATFSHKGRREESLSLPRPERRRAEQRLLRRGLRTPVLRRRLDLAADFGGGVPAPARVVEH